MAFKITPQTLYDFQTSVGKFEINANAVKCGAVRSYHLTPKMEENRR